MKRSLITMALALVVALSLAAPAFAATGAGGAGESFGTHHAEMALEMGGFSGTENPGVHHQGLSGWGGI